MITWSGQGYLVAVVGFGCCLVVELLTEAAFHDDGYYQSHAWPMCIAFFVAGIIVWFLGRKLNSKGARRLIDPETGEEFTFKRNHSLFFIPVEYWVAVFFVLGVVCLFVR